jgi:hypothetical protein
VAVDSGVVRFAQALVVQIAHNLTNAILAWLEVARMSNQITERSHIAQVALAREIARRVAQLALAVATRVVVHARPLVVVIQTIVINHGSFSAVFVIADRRVLWLSAALACSTRLGTVRHASGFLRVRGCENSHVVFGQEGLVEWRRFHQCLHVVVLVAVLSIRDAKCRVLGGKVTRHGRIKGVVGKRGMWRQVLIRICRTVIREA